MRRSLILFAACLLPVAAAAQSDPRIIYASVVDKNGAPVLGLGVSDFLVREDNVSREILSVSPDRDPMQIALLVDDSRFMRGREVVLRQSVAAFIRAMRQDVLIALIGLGERPTIRVEYTRDREKLLKAAGELWGHGSNAFNDGVFESATALSKRPLMRSVIVAITAGFGGYKHRIDVLDQLAWSQASLHVVTVSARGGASSRLVQEGTQKTGGRDDVIIGINSLESHVVHLATELSNQYRVTFARPQRLIPPKKTEIDARNPELHARGMLVLTDQEHERLPNRWGKK
ncbi:MAG: VWA domain-containing protein [Vicinamibacterales bacterium]|nr:VWA domain-containing protein [Vicinamibacterales bacterium]